MRTLRIHPAASEEAADAAGWYESERRGLGSDFEFALNAAIDVIEQDIVPLVPVRGAAGKLGVKRLVLRRFPYSVVVVERPHELLILAIAHQARRPGYWRSRLRAF